MATYSAYTNACCKKFILHLSETNKLKINSIEKDVTRNLFIIFAQENNIKINFGRIFRYLLNWLKRKEDLNCLYFKPKKLQNLLFLPSNKKLEIDNIIQGYNHLNITKKTLVNHRVVFQRSNKTTEVTLITQEECKFCNVYFTDKESFDSHLLLEDHIFRRNFFTAYNTQKSNKTVRYFELSMEEYNIDNIILRKNKLKNLTVQFKNVAKELIEIVSINCSPTQNDDIIIEKNNPVILNSLEWGHFMVILTPKNDGIIHYPIVFHFKHNEEEKMFAAELIFHIHDEFLDDLHPKASYVRPSKASITYFTEPIDLGEPPNMDGTLKPTKPLGDYKCSTDLVSLLNRGLKKFEEISSAQSKLLQDILSLLDVKDKFNCLTPKNYTELLDLLIFIEEHQMRINIHDYDCESHLEKEKHSKYFTLAVPGLAEYRPSVLVGDVVNIRTDKKNTKQYGGYVHRVTETILFLKFSPNFEEIYQKGMKFYISFTFNRYPLKTEHQALELAKQDNIKDIFFPRKIIETQIPAKIELNWFNRNIVDNRQQQEAIYCILNNTSLPYPYLIFGPPGTGKTVTVVEAIKQIHKSTTKNILVCAPSNSAANEITKRLVTSIPTTDLVRYLAYSYLSRNSIPPEIIKYCNYKDGIAYLLSSQEFTKFRIIITTLCNAAKLINFSCPKNHFSYVFIDESGQATETETLIPIAGLLSNNSTLTGQVVLAGDPKQLGPIIHSTLAIQYGLGTSMLERFMNTLEPYAKKNGEYNPAAVTKLVLNYRSHPVIIKKPNELFYENELKAVGERNQINIAVNSFILPKNKKIPIIFHNVLGADAREAKSPSFFNLQEVDVVVSYLGKLIDEKLSGMKINNQHIGIISPYKKQVEKIRSAWDKKKPLGDDGKLMIGSVEQFQGQERLIIIISTVRSQPGFLEFDNNFHLGFLNNPKRFNVAMTRAKALLIVVGNGNLLQGDVNWRSFLKYCVENNAIAGESFTLEEEIDANLSDAISKLELNIAQNNIEDGPNFSRGNI